MADEIVAPAVEPASAPSAEPSTSAPESGPESHRARVFEKFGGPPAGPSGGSEPTPAVTAAQPTPAAKVETPRRSAYDIDPQFANRISAKARAEAAERENAELRSAMVALAERERRAAQPGAPAADPMPDFNRDPQAWYEWKDRQRDLALTQQLAPVVEQAQRFQQTEQQQRQVAEQRQAIATRALQMADVMDDAEAAYMGTPEGADYRQRVPFYLSALARKHHAMGAADPQAEAAHELLSLGQFALRNNINPAVYVDQHFQQLREAFSPQAAPTPAPIATPVAPPAPPVNQRLVREQEQLRAAGQSGVAGSLSTSGAPKNSAAGAARNAAKATSTKELYARLQEDPAGGSFKERMSRARRQIATGG